MTTAIEYHDDPCPTPSLSSSIANLLLTTSPAHARLAHPRLNPAFAREHEEKFDVGTAAHHVLLEGDTADVVTIIDADDWRTKAAKETRDAARAAGRLPLLEKQWDAVQAMVAAVREQLARLDVDPPLFVEGDPEQTISWQDAGGVWCRSRIDWLHHDHEAVDDFKTTARSANPEQFSRTLFGMGYDVQAAFYKRGVRAVHGHDPAFRFVVVETSPPYALSVISLAPDALELANAKVDRALAIWRECLEADRWPAYPAQVCYAVAPAWEHARWSEREAREELAA